jgi:hypothetical protein
LEGGGASGLAQHAGQSGGVHEARPKISQGPTESLLSPAFGRLPAVCFQAVGEGLGELSGFGSEGSESENSASQEGMAKEVEGGFRTLGDEEATRRQGRLEAFELAGQAVAVAGRKRKLREQGLAGSGQSLAGIGRSAQLRANPPEGPLEAAQVVPQQALVLRAGHWLRDQALDQVREAEAESLVAGGLARCPQGAKEDGVLPREGRALGAQEGLEESRKVPGTLGVGWRGEMEVPQAGEVLSGGGGLLPRRGGTIRRGGVALGGFHGFL